MEVAEDLKSVVRGSVKGAGFITEGNVNKLMFNSHRQVLSWKVINRFSTKQMHL